MEFLISYWWVILIAVAAISVAGYLIYTFIKMPTNNQITKVKEWLLYAVTEAEKTLGSGTGQLKLRYVYDMFILRFGYLSKVVSFDSFSLLVDEVLDKFRGLLGTNTNLQDYVLSKPIEHNI